MKLMKKYNMLVLTDHLAHSDSNSVYELSEALRRHPSMGRLHLASRSNEANRRFFYDFTSTELEVWSPRRKISYERGRTGLTQRTKKVDARFYDVIWLRLPRPIPQGFFSFLTAHIDERRIINRPSGIVEAGSKAFLINFPELCPPIKYCRQIEDIWTFHEQFPIVLKPVENYGGRGVLKVQRGQVYEGQRHLSFREALPILEKQLSEGGYLAMKFMKNVHQGDKRIVVVNGEIVGSALRLPPKGGWICNSSQGGDARSSEADERERWMVDNLNQALLPRGIAMYGIDTLVGDDGLRILSEVNTLSIGGVKQMAALSGRPLVQKSADLLMEYIQGNVPFRKGVMTV
jgi:glutathione synthase